jgi:hypothetical protein
VADPVPFEQVAHLVVVEARVNGEAAPFVFDSGIGLTTLSTAFAERAGVRRLDETFTGRRMSGQAVEVPLALAGRIEVGPFRSAEQRVGLLDLDGLPPELEGLGGFLSLAAFGDAAVTVDYDGRALSAVPVEGTRVPLSMRREGPSLDPFMALVLPSGREIEVEVDMGSDELILDERFAPDVGVDLADPSLSRREGEDETGHRYRRTFGRFEGAIHPAGAPELVQEGGGVMFQSIIHDGLIGHAFLSRGPLTWDLPGSALVFGPLSRK